MTVFRSQYKSPMATTIDRIVSLSNGLREKLQKCFAGNRILVVEFRDEIFARLEADFLGKNWVVDRAKSGAEVAGHIQSKKYDLILANSTLPDESGWLMVSKLQISQTKMRVWLYAAHENGLDPHWIAFTGVERMFYYDGDILRLSLEIQRRLCGQQIEKQTIAA